MTWVKLTCGCETLEQHEWYHWFAGLVDGEGCCHLRFDGACRAHLKVALRGDDTAILHEIVKWTGVGKVYSSRSREQTSVWMTLSRSAGRVVRDLLVAHPLRAKKRRDFGIWSDALDAWSRGDQEGFIHLIAELKKIRLYENGELEDWEPIPDNGQLTLEVGV